MLTISSLGKSCFGPVWSLPSALIQGFEPMTGDTYMNAIRLYSLVFTNLSSFVSYATFRFTARRTGKITVNSMSIIWKISWYRLIH